MQKQNMNKSKKEKTECLLKYQFQQQANINLYEMRLQSLVRHEAHFSKLRPHHDEVPQLKVVQRSLWKTATPLPSL